MSSEKGSALPHISIQNDDAEGHDNPKTNGTPRSSTGWDGKLRVEKDKKAELVNPEAISDPEYSDEEQVLPGEVIAADEGILIPVPPYFCRRTTGYCGVISESANQLSDFRST
jgi:protein phosphatase 1 regulatory subunit 7